MYAEAFDRHNTDTRGEKITDGGKATEEKDSTITVDTRILGLEEISSTPAAQRGSRRAERHQLSPESIWLREKMEKQARRNIEAELTEEEVLRPGEGRRRRGSLSEEITSATERKEMRENHQ